jgi:Tol biopolymer transport system component
MLKKNSYLILLFISVIGFSQTQTKPDPAFDFLKKYMNTRDLALSSTQDEVYFTVQNTNEEVSVIAFSKKENKKWSEPKLINFTSKFRDIEPFLSSDGLKLYFSSNRPLHDSVSKPKDYDIWYVERLNLKSDWSAPKNLGAPVNTSNNEFYPSLAKNGNLYFTSDGSKSLGKDDVFFSKWENNNYSEPTTLGLNINSAGYEFNAFVSPDEKFLIFTGYNRTEGLGSGDLHISYKDKNGEWEKAKNMGTEVNSPLMDYCPFYDFKTETLYFTSKRNSVSNLGFKTIKEFETEINKYENGLSRIYKLKIKL